MQEVIIKIQKSPNKNKKYLAYLKNKRTGKVRKIHFGAHNYQQFKDTTKLKIYAKYNHLDPKRRQNYFSRHSGVRTKREALKKEIKKSNGLYTAKILSHKFLW